MLRNIFHDILEHIHKGENESDVMFWVIYGRDSMTLILEKVLMCKSISTIHKFSMKETDIGYMGGIWLISQNIYCT